MNRLTLLAGAGALLIAVVSAWGEAPTSTTQPDGAALAAPGAYSSVLVLPFAPADGASEWIGKGIQEDLATEMVRQSRLNVLTPNDAQSVSDATIAAKVGRDRGASLVAFGTYQILESDVRINGQLVDATTGKSVAALKATGPRRDLFHMEDLLAAQAISALPAGSIKVGGGAYADSNEPSPAPATNYANQSGNPYNSEGYYVTPGPDLAPYNYNPVSSAPVNNYYYDSGYPGYYDSPYGYSSPWYGYGYPYFWGGGFFIVNSGHHHHDHDGDRGGWSNGRWTSGTEGHRIGVANGTIGGARSPIGGARSTLGAGQLPVVIRGGTGAASSFNNRGSVRTSPGIRSSVGSGSFGRNSIGGGTFRSGGGFGMSRAGGGGMRGGGGGHR